MRSVQNIAKITSAMKMVAASKMRVAQVNTEKSRGLLTPFLKLLGDLPGTSSATS
jgi:F-type H+-transporting ATPase subunit gamma